MNILFLSCDYPPNYLGGVGTYTAQFAHYLAGHGHRAFVITQTEGIPCEYFDRGVRVWRVRPQRVAWLDPIRTRYPVFTGRLEYSIAVAARLRNVVHRYPIDVVESCESRTEGFWYFLWHRRPKLFIKLHTPDAVIFPLNQQMPSKDLELILALESWWLHRATTLVTLTDAVKERVGQAYQIKTRNTPKVRIPANSDFFHPDTNMLSDNELRVLYVGRLEFRKGIHVLLRAIPRVLQAVPNAHFTFIGGDWGMGKLLHTYQQDPRCRGHIHWRESYAREEIRDAYQRSHITVVPSLWENHPIVCLEAMSCGCAVVASRVGGIPEIIEDGISGVLVPAGSSYALGQALVRLLTDARRREALGRQARLHMKQHYDPERVFGETLAVYQGLLNGRNGHGIARA